MPLRSLVRALNPTPPAEVMAAAGKLRYRDFLMVALIINRADLFPDNWIYVHDSSVSVARIQNYGNWSSALVPDSSKSCLGMEYFCFSDDAFWNLSDQELIAVAKKDLRKLGLDGGAAIEDGKVVRVRKAYPMYDQGYAACLSVVREFVSKHIPDLQLIGRNGMHRYNNQDHAIMTGFLAARNVLAGRHEFDPWSVNQDAQYLEEGKHQGA
jgi:protoporphyrinogen oxidase